MDSHTLFAVAAIVLALVRYGMYIYSIFKGETRPHTFTWFLLGSVTTIAAVAQFKLDAGPSSWALASIGLICYFVAVLAFFKGEKDYTKSDWIAFVFCIGAIVVWQLTANPLTALIIVIAVDILSFWPTVRKSYNKPHTEPPISAALSSVRYLLILLSVPNPSWKNIIYPLYLFVLEAGFVVYLVVRRWQLGYPLHEFSRKN